MVAIGRSVAYHEGDSEVVLRIGIIGWEDEAVSLAQGWVGHHRLIVGTPDPEGRRGEQLASLLGRALVLEVEDASGADVVVLCVSNSDLARTALQMGDLEGRILVDCTWGPPDPHLGEQSTAEALQVLMPNARVVRAMPEAGTWSEKGSAMLCGDEADAVAKVAELLQDAGWAPVQLGVLRLARKLGRVNVGRHDGERLHIVS